MDEAVRQQQDLLVEFEKIVNELNNILANLEGSTLVKRLKAASREQYRVAGRVGDLLEGSFGKMRRQIGAPQKTVYVDLSKVENTSSQKRLHDHGRSPSLFRAPQVPEVQDGAWTT